MNPKGSKWAEDPHLATVQRFKIAHLLGISGLAGLFVLGYLLTFAAISNQKDDARVINLAGRQRMLSQKISKLVHEIPVASGPEVAELEVELDEALDEFEAAHRWLLVENGLLRDACANGPEPRFDPEELGVDLEAIVGVARSLRDSRFGAASTEPIDMSEFGRIERRFLRNMNKTVGLIEDHVTRKLGTFREQESWIFGAILLALVAEMIFFFRPIARLIRLKMLEQSRRLRQAQRAQTRAENSERMKTAFVTKISHELRTPLHGIGGSAHLLLKDPSLGPEHRIFVSMIDNANVAMSQRIEDLFVWSQLESGCLELRPEKIDVSALGTRLLRPLAEEARKKGLNFDYHGPIDPPEVEVDPELLRRAILEPVRNAVTYTDQGFVRVALTVLEGAGGRRIEIRVEDSGRGFDPDAAETTSAFRQGDDSLVRRDQGLGLGLNTLCALLDLAGGRIELDSRPGRGSRVRIDLPVRKSELRADPAGLAGDLADQRILVVEDNPVNSLLVRRILEGEGASVGTAENGLQAVEACRDESWDLILMDLQMPVMDGFEATRRLRADGIHTPIVALTANSLDGERERADDAGMNGFLTKPMNVEDLLKTLGRVA